MAKKRSKRMRRRRPPRPPATPNDIAQVAAGTIAINTYGQNANKETLNDPVLTSMAMALLDAVKRAKPGQDDEPLAMAVGMAMAAAMEYGRSRANSQESNSE